MTREEERTNSYMLKKCRSLNLCLMDLILQKNVVIIVGLKFLCVENAIDTL